MKEIKEVLIEEMVSLLEKNPIVLNIHDRPMKIKTVVKFQLGDEVFLCAISTGDVCCLNPIELMEGKLKLTPWSIGNESNAHGSTIKDILSQYAEVGEIKELIMFQ